MTNNEFTYWSVFRHLRLWFMSRWWDALASNETIMDYINLTIQDIYNQDSATFLYVTEELEWTIINWKKVFTTTFPIRKVNELLEIDIHWNLSCDKLTPTLFALKSRWEFKFDWYQIITDASINKISVTYVKDYEYAIYPEDMVTPIPLPKRYLPALLKLSYDWSSPINLMDWEMTNVDMYWHWRTRLKELADMDSVTDFMDVTPAYR